jgi:hypothetical protein
VRSSSLIHDDIRTCIAQRVRPPPCVPKEERLLCAGEIVFPNRAKGGRTWETTYADWKHDDWKYYWRDLPLRLKPSVAELAAQAEKADSPEKRLRYTTIVELIEREIPMLVH